MGIPHSEEIQHKDQIKKEQKIGGDRSIQIIWKIANLLSGDMYHVIITVDDSDSEF